MKEIVSINLGQAGVQIGTACWELLCLEHGISNDGHMTPIKLTDGVVDSPLNVFREYRKGIYVPRCLFADTDPTTVDQIQQGKMKNLFEEEQFFVGREDAANNFARGRYTLGYHCDSVNEKLRHLVEECDRLQGFVFCNSVGGGTGSGIGSLLLDKLNTDYRKCNVLQFAVYPASQQSESCVEPYNAIFHTTHTLDYAIIAIPFNNKTISKVCRSETAVDGCSFSKVNEKISQIISFMTGVCRFKNMTNIDLKDFCMEMIPHTRLHFITTSYANHQQQHQSVLPDIVHSSLTSEKLLINSSIKQGLCMAAYIFCRGAYVVSDEVENVLGTVNKKIKFVEWRKKGFKISVNRQNPVSISKNLESKISMCMVSNSTSIKEVWDSLVSHFKIMCQRRAFFHWYLSEGMDKNEFQEAEENMENLIEEYEELQK